MKINKLLPILTCALLATMSAPRTSHAAVPTTIAAEGLLSSAAGGSVADGNYSITFRIYQDAEGGAPLWSEGPLQVAVKNGAFAQPLGKVVPLSAAVMAGAGYLTLQVGADPELPRKPLRSVLFAQRAAVADGLACSGCVTAGMLDAGVFAGFAKTAALPDVAKSGNYEDLLGLPTLAKVGTACGSGLVVKGIKADGSLECVASTLDATALPPDGLAVVSNGILTNVFPSIFASATAPKAVPDNDPFGILDDITVPDKGVVTALTVAVDISNSDTTGLKVTLLDPSNAPYVLYNGGVAGTSLKASYPDVQKPLSGDLGAWVGKNPKGKWRLQVVDTKAGPGGNDGQINAWSVSVKTLSSDTVQVKGDLVVDGGLSVGGKPMPQVWTAENLALAPGETLSIDTKLGEVPLAVSAWVKVGAEWKLITPNVPEMACPACGNGQDGDFNPNQAVTLVGGRWYNFRTFTLPAGVSLQASNGPLLIAVQGTAKIDGSIQVSGGAGDVGKVGDPGPGGFGGSAGPGGGGAGKKVSCVGDNCAVNVSCTLTGAGGGGFGTPGGDGSGNAPTGGQSYPPENTGLYKGGSGGGAGAYYCSGNFGGGGGGGGAIVLVAKVVSIGATGAIRADGGAGSCGILSSGGGGGAGGYVEIRADDLNIGGLLSAQGGAGGKCPQGNGGNGGDGVINVAANKVVGQSKPAYNAVPAVGLPASSAASFVVKTSAGSVKVNNDGGTSRAVRLVVLR